MRIAARLLAVTALGLCLAGCSTHRAFTYPLEPIARASQAPAPVKIAVLPATDGRQISNNPAGYFLGMIPGFPLGWVNYERPESAKLFVSVDEFNMNVAEDIPKAIAQHLERAGAAKTAFFDYGGNIDRADYTLETEISRTVYRGKLFTYCLGPFGAFLWVIGFPEGHSTVEISLTLRLKDHAGKTVWDARIEESSGMTQWLYAGMGRDMEGMARGLQVGLDKALREHSLPSSP